MNSEFERFNQGLGGTSLSANSCSSTDPEQTSAQSSEPFGTSSPPVNSASAKLRRMIKAREGDAEDSETDAKLLATTIDNEGSADEIKQELRMEHEPSKAEEEIMEKLGIEQALGLLEKHYPRSMRRIQCSNSDFDVERNRYYIPKGEVPMTVVDLFMAGYSDSRDDGIERIEEVLGSYSSEERETFKPDYEYDQEPRKFPYDLLPPAAREIVEEMVKLHQVVPELPSALAIGVASAACGKGIVVKSVNAMVTHGNLYIIGGGRSGTGKSNVAKFLLKPLYDFQARLKAKQSEKVEAIKTKLATAQKRQAGGKPGEQEDECGIVVELETELKAASFVPRTIVDDATSAKLSEIASQNNGTIACISPDARSAVKNLKGQHNRGHTTDEDVYLKGFSVEPILQDRVTRASVDTVACFTILWLTQLENMKELYGKEALTESGLLCRFLPFEIPYRRPPKRYDEVEFPLEAIGKFSERVTEILEAYHQNQGEVFKVTACVAARKTLVDFDERIRDFVESEFRRMESFAVRVGEQAWRMALVLHVLEHGGKAHLQEMSLDTAKGAVNIVWWFFQQTVKFFGDVLENAGNELDAMTVAFVERHEKGVTARDLFRYKQGKFENSDDARRTLEKLASEGAIKAGDAQKHQRFFPRSK